MHPHELPVLLALACLLGMASRAAAAACEPVRIPLCGSMPWNMTKMPNHLHHSTQANAVLAIEQFEGLLGTGCSPDLLFFLCAMYAPICTIDFQHEPIKPCKAVCERAKCGCEPVMKLYNHSWPESLSCNELPLYDRGVCISPEAIVKAEGPESSPDFPNNLHCKGPIEDRCTCKTVHLDLQTYLKKNYNYVVIGVVISDFSHSVIRARVKEVRTRGLELTAAVEVKEVLKSSLVNIPRETHTLFYTSSCPCPPLSPGKDYIILGYENEESSRY
ncbi:Secreted frizzled-related protein 3 [Merluccius polli]|uniref:Secreted frizzled-related protein 3 n=1 Tax=Merluccius polli TaxID=89951 RepID=A0AA47NY25_MERPO|nr:Secreted frizzled-related protein 3 [Merluccius polli]